MIKIEGKALGTYYLITCIGAEDVSLATEIDSLLTQISEQFSIFDTTSQLYRINHNQHLPFTKEMIDVFNLSYKVSEATNGAFDITVAPLVELWGFGKEKRATVTDEMIDSVMQFVGYKKVKIEDGYLIKQDSRMMLNFNAVAKGFAVDKVGEWLTTRGYHNYVVDIGGEVVTKGSKYGKKWKVGIQTPTQTADGAIDAQYLFPLKNQAVATSGSYRNYIEDEGIRYSHTISPYTGRPLQNSVLSVSVIASDCATADAFATAFMVWGVDSSLLFLENNSGLAACFIYNDNGKLIMKKSPNFP